MKALLNHLFWKARGQVWKKSRRSASAWLLWTQGPNASQGRFILSKPFSKIISLLYLLKYARFVIEQESVPIAIEICVRGQWRALSPKYRDYRDETRFQWAEILFSLFLLSRRLLFILICSNRSTGYIYFSSSQRFSCQRDFQKKGWGLEKITNLFSFFFVHFLFYL